MIIELTQDEFQKTSAILDKEQYLVTGEHDRYYVKSYYIHGYRIINVHGYRIVHGEYNWIWKAKGLK